MSSEAAIAEASPRSKIKFLCSHGGRILPRPVDGHLKYVGGETRVVAVSRDLKFPDLIRKLTEIFPGDVVLKYQILSQDLDTLVSVKSDEDLKHLIDEYDRYKSEGTPKLRTFLFPAKPIVVETHLALTDANALEQRYIDAINGIIRTTAVRRRRPSTNANSISSPGPSPKSASPDGHTVDSATHDAMLSNAHQNQNPPPPPELALPKRFSMYKVHSSPSLYNLGNNNSQSPHNNNYSNNGGAGGSSNAHSPRGNGYGSNQNSSSSNLHVYQQHSPHNYYPNQHQHYQNAQGYQSPAVRVGPEPHKGGLLPWMVPSVVPMERPAVDRPDMSRFYVNQAPNYYYPPNVPQKWDVPQKWNGGGGGGGKYYDENSPYGGTPEVRSRAQSPRLEWSAKGVE